ncbi:MAG: hypothetical protein HY784_11425, partial [Chloroflexi bacterium]|nr:hypothetical protein [Chloroflexota bacterium]
MSAPPGRLLFVLTVFYGTTFFCWLGYEERDSRAATALGVGLTLLAGLHWLPRLTRGLAGRRRRLALAGAGLALGLAAAPLTATLMAVKVSLHGHASPDFPAEVVLGLLRLTPVWGLA